VSDARTGASPVELQADALVDDIERKVAQTCRELREAAGREADAVRQRARLRARRQMRRAIQDMRAVADQRLQQARAELETEARQLARTRATAALSAAWPQLAAAIEQRWREPAARAAWIDAQIGLARTRLGPKDWTVRHPGARSEGENGALQVELQAALHARGIVGAVLQPDAGSSAGLIIEVGRARLDSTARALLADRSAVEAALLAALEPDGARAAGGAQVGAEVAE
jgi:hypothetical protein